MRSDIAVLKLALREAKKGVRFWQAIVIHKYLRLAIFESK